MFLSRALVGALSLIGLVSSTEITTRTTSQELVQPRLEQLTLSPDFEITSTPTTRTYDWTITQQRGAPDGFYRDMLVVNGQYPGPTIEANDGDTIIINVKNRLPEEGTSLHWHGLLQNGTAWMDGPAGVTQCPIPAGGDFTYKFKIEGQYGTFWWHAHAGAQMSDGIQGAFIVHSVNDPLKRGVHYDYDQVLIVSDWYHNTSTEIIKALDSPKGYFNGSQAAPPPRSGMFNGYGTWDCEKFGTPETCFTQRPYELQVYPNKKYRMRIINTAAHAMFYNSFDSHTLDIIEADDTAISSKAVNGLHRLTSHNGQRYSVVVSTDQGKPGDAFWMRAEIRGDCLPYVTPDFANTTLAVMRYIDSTPGYEPTTQLPKTKDWKDALGEDCKDMDSADLVPLERNDPPKFVSQQGIFNTRVGRVNTTDGTVTRFFTNNVTFEHHSSNQPLLYDVVEGRGLDKKKIMSLTFDKPEGADIIINNLDARIDHPYHLHGMTFWIVAEGKGALTIDDYKKVKFNTDNPLRRDTHVIPAASWAVYRVKADNPGVWFMHCHIDWHMAHGFAAAVVVQPEVVKQFQIPQSSKELCNAPGLKTRSTRFERRELPVPKQFSYDLSKRAEN